MSLVWVDSVSRAGDARKRHVYQQGHGGYIRECGVDDSDGPLKKRDLVRVEAVEWATDVNACERCKDVLGLSHYEPRPQGARSVEYDPFGVFGGGSSE